MSQRKTVDLYRRILKYPPFATGKRTGYMNITHVTNHGKVVARAVEYVTSEDAEKLFCVIYFAQKNKTVKVIPISDDEFGNVIRIDIQIKDIKKIINNHDEKSIINAINRLQSLDVTYFETAKGKVISQIGIHPLLRYRFIMETGSLTLFLDPIFYESCKEKSLTIDLGKYSSLSPTGKNLYGYISSNSSNSFTENKLIERMVVSAKRKDKAQGMLKKALMELKENHIIKNFKIEKKDAVRLINIERQGRKIISRSGWK